MVEAPLLAAAVRERLAEQLARLADAQEPVLVGRLGVRVSGRDFQPVHSEFVIDVVEGRDQVLRGLRVEHGRVRVDLEALLLGQLDRRDGLLENAFLGDRLVVLVADAVEMHHPGEVLVRLELTDVLGQQDRVRAQDHELLALEQFLRDHVDLRVHQRLAAGDRDHRRAALFHRGDRLLDRHALLQYRSRMLDLAAARALEVTGEQRLQLHDQRVLLDPLDLLLYQVRSELYRQVEWHRHEFVASGSRAGATRRAVQSVWNIQAVCLIMAAWQRNRNHGELSTPPTPGPRSSPPRASFSQLTAMTAPVPNRSSLTRASPAGRSTTTSATRRTCFAPSWPKPPDQWPSALSMSSWRRIRRLRSRRSGTVSPRSSTCASAATSSGSSWSTGRVSSARTRGRNSSSVTGGASWRNGSTAAWRPRSWKPCRCGSSPGC